MCRSTASPRAVSFFLFWLRGERDSPNSRARNKRKERERDVHISAYLIDPRGWFHVHILRRIVPNDHIVQRSSSSSSCTSSSGLDHQHDHTHTHIYTYTYYQCLLPLSQYTYSFQHNTHSHISLSPYHVDANVDGSCERGIPTIGSQVRGVGVACDAQEGLQQRLR